jgi:hypothetical protein
MGSPGSDFVGNDWNMMDKKDVLGSDGKKYLERLSKVGG